MTVLIICLVFDKMSENNPLYKIFDSFHKVSCYFPTNKKRKAKDNRFQNRNKDRINRSLFRLTYLLLNGNAPGIPVV